MSISFTYDNVIYEIINTTMVTISGYESPPNPWDLVIPNTVTYDSINYTVVSIKIYAFYGCISLRSCIIPDSITIIGNFVFYGCSSLISCIIPYSITSIGVSIFQNCSSLTNIIVDSLNQNYSSLNDVLFNKLQTTLLQYPLGKNQTSYTIPSSVTTIDISSFNGANILNNIIIPDSVNTINDYAFIFCTSLINITIPYNVIFIGNYAFLGCTSLTSITFNQLTSTNVSFGSSVFTNDTLLENVYLIYPNTSIETYFSTYYPDITVTVIGPPLVPCFKEGSKILTDKGYIYIEQLRKGDLVKTLKNNYLPIVLIGKSVIYNPGDKERIKNRLYNLSTENYKELTEDLVLTGCHSILVDFIKEY